MKRLSLLAAICLLGCSSPDSKSGSNNGASNNGDSNNGGATILDPNDYDRSCEFDFDCEHVFGGEICECRAECPGAINANAVELFEADRAAIVCTEPPRGCPDIGCAPQIAVCSSGTCASIAEQTVTVDEFDQTCETAADCVLVRTGPICDACDCGRGAININAVDEYEGSISDADCNPGPSSCDCAPPQEVDCIEGMCVGG